MAAGAAAHAAMIANATKASGAIVRVSPGDFLRMVERNPSPLVVVARGGLFQKHFKYLSSYKGLVLYAQSPDLLVLPRGCEVIEAQKIWIPD